MRAVAQRVIRASVTVGDARVGAIDHGLLVYLGVGRHDHALDVASIVEKVSTLRVYEGDSGKMERSVIEAGGSVLVVSQFTLYGDVRHGRRPSFTAAAEPSRAEELYLAVVAGLREVGLKVETGRFRATMVVHADVDGPVTILIDTQKTF